MKLLKLINKMNDATKIKLIFMDRVGEYAGTAKDYKDNQFGRLACRYFDDRKVLYIGASVDGEREPFVTIYIKKENEEADKEIRKAIDDYNERVTAQGKEKP